ncbi:MAG: hypothetical protein R2685_01160 [Candidatus Nitrosocosmicus sp.]|nr:hypothetical protein [Candidatus Nitrosocosmicus sp.]
MTFSLVGSLGNVFMATAQTPTTSDLPSTIGNESTSNMGLTNNTLPVQNATTIYAPPPV